MPDLILLNGPPASGKSTIAALLVASRPLALHLDVDRVRGSLGASMEQPEESGRAARRIALAAAAAHLTHGHDVVVPQMIARDPFVLQLEVVARESGARFVEIALMSDLADTVSAFTARSTSPETQAHRDAAELVQREGGEPALRASHDRLMNFLRTRPSARLVQVVRGDTSETLRLVEVAIATQP